VDDLQVNLANADRELKRSEKLTEAGVSTPQALDTARTLTESYRARISLTKEKWLPRTEGSMSRRKM